MPNYSKKIVYLSKAQYQELLANNSITVNGVTVTYNENDLYVTPQEEPITSVQLNGSSYTPTNGAIDLGHVLTSMNNSIIAPVESTSTASRLYNEGEFFIYNDLLYKVTNTIAAEATIIPDTNCEVAQVMNCIPDIQINGTSIVSNSVANIPIATNNTAGVMKVSSTFGLSIDSNDRIIVNKATDAQIKPGNNLYASIVPANQHISTFYALAKAAGDTTQSSSDNAVGTYTESAKTAIQTMLGVEANVPLIEMVTGTTPTITGQPNVRYICEEVSVLTITPPANGTIVVRFNSGSTATILTVPNTVKWPAWFDATSLDTEVTYEIIITDGVYGGVMSWA